MKLTGISQKMLHACVTMESEQDKEQRMVLVEPNKYI